MRTEGAGALTSSISVRRVDDAGGVQTEKRFPAVGTML